MKGKSLALLSAAVVVVVAYGYLAIVSCGPFDSVLCQLTHKRLFCGAVKIGGFVAPGYEAVYDAFRLQFDNGDSLGAQLVLWKNGREVINLYGRYEEDNYDADSLQIVFSSTKVFAPLTIAKLMELGLLDIHDPVAKYWPEFAQHGKEKITISDILRHESGLDGFNQTIPWSTFVNLDNPDLPFHQIAENSSPLWHEESPRAYHAMTGGLLLNEIVKRVDPQKRNLGTFFYDEFAQPLGIDFYIGLPSDKFGRFHKDKEWPFYYMLAKAVIPHTLGLLEDQNLKALFDHFSNPKIKQMRGGQVVIGPTGGVAGVPELVREDALKTISPGSNGVTNAKSMGKLLALMANYGELDGIRLLKKETMLKMLETSTEPKMDLFFNRKTHFTDGGWGISMFPGLEGFSGWAGLGGSIAQFSPQKNAVFSFAMNGCYPSFIDPRTVAIRSALPDFFLKDN